MTDTSHRRRVLLGLGAAILGLGAFLAARNARRGDAPVPVPMAAESSAPAPAHPSAGTKSASDPPEALARARLATHPDDLEARLELARVSLDREDFMAVWTETQRVLQASPGNPRALTYQSQVRLAMGRPDVALDLLHKALEKDPDLLQAHIYEGYVYLRMGRTKEAADVLARAKRRFPAQAEMLERGFADMRAAVGKVEPFVPGADPDPHAGLGGKGHAGVPAAGGFNPHASGPAKASAVAGTLEIDARWRASVPAAAVVFVTAREAGVGGGPPIAAKRLLPSAFPLAFELSDADSMAGEALPGRLTVEARVDRDGDAATKDPADPVARQDDVPIGTRELRLVLSPRRQ